MTEASIWMLGRCLRRYEHWLGSPAIATTLSSHGKVERIDRHSAVDVFEWEIRVVGSMPRGGTTGPDGGEDRFAGMRRVLKPGCHQLRAGEIFPASAGAPETTNVTSPGCQCPDGC